MSASIMPYEEALELAAACTGAAWAQPDEDVEGLGYVTGETGEWVLFPVSEADSDPEAPAGAPEGWVWVFVA